MDNIFTIVGIIITIFEIAIAIYKYVSESERQKYLDTINVFNDLLTDTYQLKDKYYKIDKDTLFNAEKLNNKLYKETMNLLTHWESFSLGLYCNVYDFRLFIDLIPKELSDLLVLLEDFVKKARIEKKYERLFKDFTDLTYEITNCIQLKIDGKKIPRKYKKRGE